MDPLVGFSKTSFPYKLIFVLSQLNEIYHEFILFVVFLADHINFSFTKGYFRDSA